MSDIAAETPERNAFTALSDVLGTAAGYVSEAGASAGASVKVAAEKSGAAVGVGAYKAAYGASYGLVFGAVFLKELLPAGNVVRRGFEEGAEAAFEAIEARKTVPDAADELPAAVKPKARRTTKVIATDAA